VVAGADPVVAVRDLQDDSVVGVAADEQDGGERFAMMDLGEVSCDVRVVRGE
jgi:hypothetical protein